MHHVRQHLPLSDLSLAVQLFAKNIDDESLPSSIQTMSCKLLLNLVDCIRSKSEQESGNGRDVLMRMLEVRCPAPPPNTRLHPRLALCAHLSALPAVLRPPGCQAGAWVFKLPWVQGPAPSSTRPGSWGKMLHPLCWPARPLPRTAMGRLLGLSGLREATMGALSTLLAGSLEQCFLRRCVAQRSLVHERF